jgi:hypothetical protein
MEWELVKPWVNRVGIVLEFLSFWFAAPEILGEERLRAVEQGVEKGIGLLPAVVGSRWTVFALGMVAGVLVSLRAVTEGLWEDLGLLGITAAAVGTGMAVVTITLEKVVEPVLRVLADDQRIRQRSLAVGTVLFVVGFLLQLIATF